MRAQSPHVRQPHSWTPHAWGATQACQAESTPEYPPSTAARITSNTAPAPAAEACRRAACTHCRGPGGAPCSPKRYHGCCVSTGSLLRRSPPPPASVRWESRAALPALLLLLLLCRAGRSLAQLCRPGSGPACRLIGPTRALNGLPTLPAWAQGPRRAIQPALATDARPAGWLADSARRNSCPAFRRKARQMQGARRCAHAAAWLSGPRTALPEAGAQAGEQSQQEAPPELCRRGGGGGGRARCRPGAQPRCSHRQEAGVRGTPRSLQPPRSVAQAPRCCRFQQECARQPHSRAVDLRTVPLPARPPAAAPELPALQLSHVHTAAASARGGCQHGLCSSRRPWRPCTGSCRQATVPGGPLDACRRHGRRAARAARRPAADICGRL